MRVRCWAIVALTLLLVQGCTGLKDEDGVSGQSAGPTGQDATVTLQLPNLPDEVTTLQFVARDREGAITAQGLLQGTPFRAAQLARNLQFSLQLPPTSAGLELTLREDFGGQEHAVLRALAPLNLTPNGTTILDDLRFDPLVLPVDSLSFTPPAGAQVGVDLTLEVSAQVGSREIRPFNASVVFRPIEPYVLPLDHVRRPGALHPRRPGPNLVRVWHQTEPSFVIGGADGQAPFVKAVAGNSGVVNSFFAYDPSFRGGVRVASGDLDGDGTAELITAPGPGMAPEVRVFRARDGERLGTFSAFESSFQGGVFVAARDLDGDGRAEILCSSGAGREATVKIFSPTLVEQSSFAAFPGFQGGVTVAAGDLDRNGEVDIVCGIGPGGGSTVRVFDPTGAMTRELEAYDAAFTGGVFVAATGDRLMTAPMAGAGSNGQVRLFDAAGLLVNTLDPAPGYEGGWRVAVADFDQDGAGDILTPPGGNMPTVVPIYWGTFKQICSDGTFAITLGDSQGGGVYAAEVPTLSLQGVTATELTLQVAPAEQAADLLVTIGPAPGSVARFMPATQTYSVLTGLATMLNAPFYMAGDPRDQTYLVVNTLAHSVAVFADAAQNNTPPLRVLTSASLNFPCGVALDPQRDLLYVSNPGTGLISVFAQASLANGNVAPVHVITGLSQPFGLAVDPHFDRLFVAQAGNHSIAVFDGASATDGAVAPNRTITSPGLQQPQHLTLDSETQRLFVASRITGLSIFDGASSLNGSVAPNLAVARPTRGVAVDLLRSQVFITATDNQIYTFELPVEIREEDPGNVVDCGRSPTHVNEDTLVPCDTEAIRFQVTCPLLKTTLPIPEVPIPPPSPGVPEAPLPFPIPAPPPPPPQSH